MTTRELKEKYLKFFEERGHKIIPSASLIPENDPTVLFTTAGMHPLVPYLLGEKHPAGDKLVNVQKCIRTSDIDEVGDDWHLTFFEMLGNWSLGSYWKQEAIEWSLEFLTGKDWLGLNKDKISVSVFAGDNDAPFDEDSYNIWLKKGIPINRIKKLPKKDNWWGPAGKTGPCGPCTEMFYWADPSTSSGQIPEVFDPHDQRWVEIWNDVFMEFNKTVEGKYKPLKQKNVDTGMGVERTTAVLSDAASIYENSESLIKIIQKIEKLSNKNYSGPILIRKTSSGSTHQMFTPNMENGGGRYDKEMRIIADHLRAAIFIMGDERGIQPSNVEQGYVVRKLIRRAIKEGKKLGIEKPFTHEIGELVTDLMDDEYPELKKNKDFIIEQLVQEEEGFGRTKKRGTKQAIYQFELREKFGEYLEKKGKKPIYAQEVIPGRPIKFFTIDDVEKSIISGKEAFDLYQTFGLSLESIKGLAEEKQLSVDEKGFQEEFKKHQELSRTATAGKFKSGLADNSEQVTKLHTATHLLLAALRKILGEHVFQGGSNITAERLRLDFSHSEKLTPGQIKQVEDVVNEQIKKDLPVSCAEISLEQARAKNAMGVFESKYGDRVKVYSVGNFSCEICAGPHVEKTGQLGHFKILKEEASSSGIRRIKAILE